MPEMTDVELIGYCDIHCETERALFSGKHINRMLALAGHPEGFIRSVPDQSWTSVHDDMKTLCRLARERLKKGVQAAQPEVQGGCRVYQFPGGQVASLA